MSHQPFLVGQWVKRADDWTSIDQIAGVIRIGELGYFVTTRDHQTLISAEKFMPLVDTGGDRLPARVAVIAVLGLSLGAWLMIWAAIAVLR